ncbi:MAG: hypothetical protein GY797_15200 [Deltaproteobacteria bacterium]|nr:hypothetical protein [Deltaproteobacteria bacterium]
MKQSNSKYARDLETLKANQAKESGLMKGRHSEESKKLAKDITSGKTKEEFDRIKRVKALRDEYNKRSSGKPTDSRKEFNEKADFRVARYMKEEREKSASLKEEFNKKKPPAPDIQKDFRVARYMKEDQKREKADDLKKDQEIKKEFNAVRDMKEEKENEKNHSRLTGRDIDREPS